MPNSITANQLANRFNMQPHEEGGTYQELEPRDTDARSASGSIYYFLPQGQFADFHQIDCDEFWVYSAGDTLELWIIDADGALSIERFGTSEGAQPLIKVTAGCIFAARHAGEIDDGTFLSCITVPKFTYQGWRLYSQDEMLHSYPDVAAFWE